MLTAITWTGAAGGNWNLASNWSTNTVPGGGDTVTIPAGASPQVTDSEDAGTLTTAAGSTFTIATNGVIGIGGGTISGSVIDHGVINGPNSAANQITFAGSTTFQNGGVGGGYFLNTGTLTLDNGSTFHGAQFSSSGTIAADGSVGLGLNTTLTNLTSGIIDITDGGAIGADYYGTGGSSPNLVNYGTIDKTGSSTGGFDADTGGGAMTLQDINGTIEATGGTLQILGPGQFDGTLFKASAGASIVINDPNTPSTVSYQFYGTVTGSGAGTLQLEGSGADVGIPNVLNTSATTSAVLNFPAGFADVSGMFFADYNNVIINQGTLNYTGSTTDGSCGVDNKGTINITGTGNFDVNRNGAFTNDTTGVLNFETDAGVTDDNGGTSFTNEGLIEKTGGAATSTIGIGTANIGFANDDGTFDIESGTLSIANGGGSFAFTIPNGGIVAAPGADFDLGGNGNSDNISVQGNLNISGGGTFSLSGDFLYGPSGGANQNTSSPATLNFAANQFTVDGGGFGDNVNLINQGSINFDSGNLGALLNEGTVSIGAGGLLQCNSAFINAVGGVMFLSGNQAFVATVSDNNGNIQNAGTIVFQPGTGNTFDISGVEMSNTGTIIFGPGTTNLPWLSNGYDEYPGLFPNSQSIPSGSTFQLDAGAIVTVATAPSLTGIAGTVIMNSGASFPALNSVNNITGSWSVLSGDSVSLTGGLTNSGTLSVGGSFTVNGAFAQAPNQDVASPPTPVLDFEVAGAAGSALAPLLTVTGATTLAGNLTADYVDGYTGSAGAYTVASFSGGTTGSFASTAGTAPFFTPSISASKIVLNGTAFSGTGGSNPGGIAIPTGGTGGGGSGGGGGGGTTTGNDDLAISSVTAPATFTAGSSQTITWAVTNSGTAATNGSWEDSVFLSTDTTLSSDDVLLGRVPETTAVAAAGSYNGTLTVDMPAVTPGAYYVIVEVDSGETLGETNYANNSAVSTATTETVPSLTLGQTTTGTLTASQQQLFALSLPSGDAVKLAATFGASLEADLFIGDNALPTPETNVGAATNPSQTTASLLINAQVAGTYYVLLDGRPDISGSQAFTLTPTILAFGPASVSPSAGAAVYQTTLTIQGNGFTPSTAVTLVAGSTTLTTYSTQFVNAQTIYATFTLANEPVGTYNVVTTNPGGMPATLSNAFTINVFNPNAGAADSVGQVDFQFNAPANIRAGDTAVATLTYENVGGTDVDDPLFEIDGTNCYFKLPDMSSFDEGSIDVIGTPTTGPAGILQPGQSNTVQITYEQGTDAAHVISKLTASLLDPINNIDWDAAKKPLQPDDQSQQAWDNTWANFESLVGTTVGSYEVELSALATQLGDQGFRTDDLGRYLSQIVQIAGEFGVINQRDTLTSFGYGQTDPYDASLTLDKAGDAAVGTTDDYEYFLVQPNGSFINEGAPTDTTTPVQNSNGTYTYTASDGAQELFSSAGALTAFVSANGQTTTVTQTSGYVTQLTNPQGQITTINRTNAGIVSSIVAPDGQTESFTYDTSDNLTSVTTPAGTVSFTYTDPSNHQVTQVVNIDGTVQNYSYDGFGRVNGESQASGADPITVSYDSLGNQTITDALGRSNTIDVGADGSADSILNPSGDLTSLSESFDGGATLITSASGTATEVTYNSAGNATSIELPTGATVTLAYNSTGQLTSIVDPDNHSTTFTYDANGNLLTSTDAANATTSYTYTTQGQPASTTTPAGRTIGNTYNAQGQLISQSFSGGGTTTYTYTGTGDIASDTISGFGTETFAYNTAGEITSITYPDGLSLSYGYNSHGQLATTTDQTGASETYAYNAEGQIDQVINATGQVLASYTYDAAGELDRIDLGNGTFTTIGYDASGRENSVINYAASGAVQSSFAYTFNPNGQVISMITLAGTTTYGYDVSGQLTSATLPSGETLTWTYDAAGNRISQIDSASGTTNYTTNNLNQYTAAGTTTCTYDADGNMLTSTTAGVTTTYAYNALEQLTSISSPPSTTTFTYDALGNRVAETVNGVTTDLLVDPITGQLTGEFSASGSVVAEYQYGLGLLGESLGSSTAATNYYQFDSNGNVAALTGASGTVLNSYTYLPFGQVQSTTGSTANLFTFDGHDGVQTFGNGNYLTHSRLYSSTLGRFTQRDPTGFSGSGSNLYQYANNDPINQSDPSGDNPLLSAGERAFVELFGYIPFNSATDLATVNALNYGISAQADVAAFNAINGGVSYANDYAAVSAGLNPPVAFTEVAATDATFVSGEAVTLTGSSTIATGTPGVLQIVPASEAASAPVLLTLSTVAVVGGTGYAFTHQDQAHALFNNVTNRLWNINIFDLKDSISDNGINTQRLAAALARTGLGQQLSSSGINLATLPIDVLEDYLMMANQQQRQQSQDLSSGDPNDIFGPTGYGTAGFITDAGTLPYQIVFENDATASAPAAVVTITETLSPNLDWSTFQLGDIGYGSTTITVPAGLQNYSTTMALTSALTLDIAASFDAGTGVVTWKFTTIDNATGDVPSDPSLGFLPPDVTPPEGEGFVNYTVSPSPTATTGATIAAQASIVFDNNAAIATPTIVNTIDAVAPTSTVDALTATQSGDYFTLYWSGSDDAGGSGIVGYTIFVSEDGGAYTPWLANTTATSAVYLAAPGHTFSFYSQAIDGAGNEQTADVGVAQANTSVPAIVRTLTFSAGKSARFTDAAGVVVTVSLSGPGTGTLSFISTGNADPVSLVLTGTTARSSVSVHAARGTLSLGTVSITGSLSSFSAPQASFLGSFSITGTLHTLTLGNENITRSTLSIGGAGVPTVIRMGVVTDLQLTTASPIASLVVASWTNGAFADSTLTAPSITTLSCAGNFDPAVTLSSTGLDLRSASIKGTLSGVWQASGSVDAISAANIASTWVATVTGGVTSVLSRTNFAGSLTAELLRTLSVTGSITDATIDLTGTAAQLGRNYALTSMSVRGDVTDSAITTIGNIDSVSVGGMTGSTLFAGVSSSVTGLPTAATQLASSAIIRSFKSSGRAVFSDSFIAATTLTSISLADVTTNNDGIPFGAAARAIGSLTVSQPKAKVFRYTSKDKSSVLATLPGDLKAELLT